MTSWENLQLLLQVVNMYGSLVFNSPYSYSLFVYLKMLLYSESLLLTFYFGYFKKFYKGFSIISNDNTIKINNEFPLFSNNNIVKKFLANHSKIHTTVLKLN